uniref:Uncharacterized protein n=1 Tax=Solanum tuberosum TaxID=4113 RepID=M1AM00_SOLTU
MSGRLKFVLNSDFFVFGSVRVLLDRRQMAGRALLGAPTQLRGYCQKISPTKTSNRVGHDVRAFIGGGLVSACFYLYWFATFTFLLRRFSFNCACALASLLGSECVS